MMDINVDFIQWLLNVLRKITSGGAAKSEIIRKKQLAEELHKPIVRKFEKRKVHSSRQCLSC